MSEFPSGLRALLDEEGRTCDLCNGLQIVLPDVPQDDPRYGRPVPCPLCGDHDAIRRHRMSGLEQLFGAYWMHNSAKMDAFALRDFVELPGGDRRGKSTAIVAATRWAVGELLSYGDLGLDVPTGDLPPSSALMLSGESSRGKTALACAAFSERLTHEVGLAIEYNALVRAVQDGYGDHRAGVLMTAVCQVPVLLLDDFGNVGFGSESEDRTRIAFQIVNHRHNHQLPTLITTNLIPSGISEQFGAKVLTRIMNWAVWVPVQGEALGMHEEDIPDVS